MRCLCALLSIAIMGYGTGGVRGEDPAKPLDDNFLIKVAPGAHAQIEISKLADSGPTEDELVKAKSFLTGSYALRFDTSSKIAQQLVQIQLDDLGIDYIDKRNGLIEAVTMKDVKRAAKRLLEGGMLVTVVGRPQPPPAKGG